MSKAERVRNGPEKEIVQEKRRKLGVVPAFTSELDLFEPNRQLGKCQTMEMCKSF